MLSNERYTEEIENLQRLIKRDLIANFNKTKEEAEQLIEESNVYDSILNDPLGLHDSSLEWALKILTKVNDIEALDMFFAK